MAGKVIGIVVAEFNSDVTQKMLVFGEKKAKQLGYETAVIKVPGAFEIPLAAKKLLEKENVVGVAALGAIVQGGTKHDEVIGFTIGEKLSQLGLDYNKPVTLGVSGPGVTRAGADERAEKMAAHAVEAVDKMVKALK